jgi:integrase
VLNHFNLYDKRHHKFIYAAAPKDDSKDFALTEEELERIRVLDLSQVPNKCHRKALEKARNTFLIQACTACRISDVSNTINNPIVDGKVTLSQKKTNEKVTIPIEGTFSFLPTLIENAKMTGVYTKSQSRLTDNIQEICKLAKINDLICLEDNIFVEKWQTITSHDGRRAFCTNMIRRQTIPELAIKKITGHVTNSKSFSKYVKLTENESADLFLEGFQKSEKAKSAKSNI